MTDHDIDLAITKIQQRASNVGGAWVSGTINDEYRFDALVFADHADSEEYELDDSKISKLWIQRTADKNIGIFPKNNVAAGGRNGLGGSQANFGGVIDRSRNFDTHPKFE